MLIYKIANSASIDARSFDQGFRPSVIYRYNLWCTEIKCAPTALVTAWLFFFSVGSNIRWEQNKANLRNLIAATGLVILPKLDSNHQSFKLCDLEIWWMTSKNNTAPLHQALCIISIPSVNLKLSYSAETLNSGHNRRFLAIFCPMWPWNSMDDLEKQQGTLPKQHQALCIISSPSVNSTLSYSPKTFNSGQNRRFFVPCDLEIWRIALKNNRARLLSNIKRCASFHRHIWIQTGVTVRKRLSWFLTSVTLTFDLWSWPFAWTSRLSMVITSDSFRMIRWQEHCQKGVTDRQTDGRTGGKKCS